MSLHFTFSVTMWLCAQTLSIRSCMLFETRTALARRVRGARGSPGPPPTGHKRLRWSKRVKKWRTRFARRTRAASGGLSTAARRPSAHQPRTHAAAGSKSRLVDINSPRNGEEGKCRSARFFALGRSQTCIIDGIRGRKSTGLAYASAVRPTSVTSVTPRFCISPEHSRSTMGPGKKALL